jgi:hypothetical protein
MDWFLLSGILGWFSGIFVCLIKRAGLWGGAVFGFIDPQKNF